MNAFKNLVQRESSDKAMSLQKVGLRDGKFNKKLYLKENFAFQTS